MALINCTECNFEVSDKASACPRCGNPLMLNDKNEATTLIEQTNKKLKLQKVFGAVAFITGILLAISVNTIVGIIIGVSGLLWMAIVEGMIWWKHK
jgi:hypothetical protein